jgi:glycogen(starch) synthase
MKALVITARYPPNHLGGFELRCHDIVQALSARGHKVRVLTSRPRVRDGKDGDDVLRLLHLSPARNATQRIAWDYSDLKHVRRVLLEWRPDVVGLFHTIVLTRSLFPLLASQGVPLVCDEGGIGLLTAWQKHGEWFSLCQRGRGGVFRRALRRAVVVSVHRLSGNLLPTEWSWPRDMRVYFNSEFNLRRHAEAGVPVVGAKVLHSGIDLDRFRYRAGRRSAGTIEFLLPGRIVPRKGIEDAIRAVGILKRWSPRIRPRLRVVGPVQDLRYYETIQRLAQRLSLEDDIAFAPMIPYEQMCSAYQSADFCLMPSQWESFSRIPLEAMACGSVLITTAAGGSREVVRHGGNGVVVPEEAPGRIAAEATRLLASDDEYLRIQQNARRYVEENHGFESYVDKVEAIFTEAATPHEQRDLAEPGSPASLERTKMWYRASEFRIRLMVLPLVVPSGGLCLRGRSLSRRLTRPEAVPTMPWRYKMLDIRFLGAKDRNRSVNSGRRRR